MRIAIVGAGVAGGVLATGLREVPGVQTVVVEQVDRDDHENAGNGLNIGPNALRTLRRALPEMAAKLERVSLPWKAWTASTIEGEPLYRIALAEVADSEGLRIRWADLYRICREAIRDELRFNTRCVAALPGALELSQADGSTARLEGFDLVVAADGRYSRLREQLCGAPAVRHLGNANFRILLPAAREVGIDDLEQWYHGPNRLLAFRVADGRVYLSGNFPIEPGADIPPQCKSARYLREIYTPHAGRLEARAAWLLDGACARSDELHWSRVQEGSTRFHDDSARVLFVGDAAHPMVPMLGQGATSAIEDAALLLTMLRAAPDADVPSLVRAFAETRAERVAFVTGFSWESSDTLQPGVDAVAANRTRNSSAYKAKMRRLYTDIPDPLNGCTDIQWRATSARRQSQTPGRAST
jgi:salicylate hydroxylase